MSALFAFAHHAAAFALVSALVIELVLVRTELTLSTARILQKADMALGISAGLLLAVGLIRVVYLEKGAAYYFHNAAFIGKLSLFLIIALLSIYPTVVLLSWTKFLKDGKLPPAPAAQLRVVRRIVHIELAGVVAILLCAALMARGIGQFGQMRG
jgi:putative membrane protein